ncbi:IclR family transcriptional regulator [Mycolicibacterium lutetiense]|uniref:DNA-binding IclR family transcriptional regulator n=1 Tax=Mycolicibacterium lutetiense TaxID=1641992 RepID=A0ABS5A2L0_9MYCO|nr:IclR family transcriptional regulator [Mycolicibacterium lutetiense]MBP2455999.1 DNA-binding IclR family transcriptional regulator [Mycolicibacterium lutetiense]
MAVSTQGPELTGPSMVERVTLILDAFEQRPTSRLNLDQIATRAHLPRSTTHRILGQLVGLQWLEYTGTQYSLGRRALRLGGQDGLHSQVRQAAADHLHRLHLRTGLVVHLAVLQGADEIFLDKVGGPFAATLPSKVGSRHVAYQTTGGRAMLAWLPPEDVDSLFGKRLARSSGTAGWDLTSLHRELARIRREHGVSIDRGDQTRTFVGIALPSVAAAVRDADGRPVAAICVCGAADSVQIEGLVPLVADAAAQTTAMLR